MEIKNHIVTIFDPYAKKQPIDLRKVEILHRTPRSWTEFCDNSNTFYAKLMQQLWLKCGVPLLHAELIFDRPLCPRVIFTQRGKFYRNRGFTIGFI